MGREFSREEDVPEGAAVAMLSDAFWQRAFHGDPEVLGHAISLRGEPYTVVGIMPRDFRSRSRRWTSGRRCGPAGTVRAAGPTTMRSRA